MKRPQLVHFLCIMTDTNISIKASVTLKDSKFQMSGNQLLEGELPGARFPIQAYRLLNSYQFIMKLVGLGKDHKLCYKKVFESDSFGNFNFKIPLTENSRDIEMFQIYEVSRSPGLDLHMGSYIPLKIQGEKKLVICDFDKTLVETRYSSTKELYNSLTRPIEYFPTLAESLKILKNTINQDFHPFILSASPHFYEEAMRDWLYKNEIYSAGIFLKDYRQILSFFDGELTPKDLKSQGLYKMNHLIDILLMTGIPDELTLMGDNFESDPVIYLTLSMLLYDDYDPWHLWSQLKKQDAFLLSKKQDAKFLNKIYQLSSLVSEQKKIKKDLNVLIYIRKRNLEDCIEVPDFFKKRQNLIQTYLGETNTDELDFSTISTEK